MKFQALVGTIKNAHLTLQEGAVKSVNKHLTVRNWLIGYYIAEFEQNGEERARYGEKLLEKLAAKLNKESLSLRNLKLFRQFYMTYPMLASAVVEELDYIEHNLFQIGQTPSAQLQPNEKQILRIGQTPSAQFKELVSSSKILNQLSFSHLSLLLPIDNHMKRAFYEVEAIRGCWSVQELKRQINTLHFERSGLSKSPAKLRNHIKGNVSKLSISDYIKSPMVFDFLDLPMMDAVTESILEKALIANLESFILELGRGFCFEAKQKRLTIGDEYFYIDLVFYHRILKCHILVELKTDEVKHEHIGQLKTYLNYFKKEVMQKGDNPPIGILLVTNQNKALVEYAVADSKVKLHVKKYVVNLPDKETLRKFLLSEIKKHKQK